jgi:thymidylate synthase (FAD)
MGVEVQLVEWLAEDRMVVNAARVLKDKHVLHFLGRNLDHTDTRLINFMMSGRHGTPFEHNYFQFRVTCPIFAQRDWMRHRTGHSFNEISTRWQEMGALGIYEPDVMRAQIGKAHLYQFSEMEPGWSNSLRSWWLAHTQRRSIKAYKRMLRLGYAREQAMAVLPMGTYTQFIWSCNARSLMHFLALRTEPTARKEIQEGARQAEHHFQEKMPITYQAWVDNGRVAP